MKKQTWSDIRKLFIKKGGELDEIYTWAIESFAKHEHEIEVLENTYNSMSSKTKSSEEVEKDLKKLRKAIREEITRKENNLDDINLVSSNSYKLQVSVPSNLNYLMKAWAAAEGRDLSSVALQCLEIGLRDMKSKGSIPSAAIKKYDHACEKRIALAELNSSWERHNELNFKEQI